MQVDLPLYQVVVSDCPSCETAHLLTEEGEIPLDGITRETIYCNASVGHLDEEGRVAKDKTTSGALRRKVLARDGNRCLCCRSRVLLHAHHVEFRGKGGRTTAGNVISTCIRCHQLIHEGLVLVFGNEKTSYVFTDRWGKRLDEEEQPVGARLREIRLAAARLKAEAAKAQGSEEVGTGDEPKETMAATTIKSLPPLIDPLTFAKHAHLFAWNERKGMLEFTEGMPVEAHAVVEAPESAADGSEALRPERLEDVIGQVEAVGSLEVAALAAKKEDRPAPHCLLEGPAGTGKTSLARAFAREMGTAAKVVYGPFIKDALGLITLLLKAARGTVYFIDEIHDLPKRVAEALYEAMEDQVISFMVYSGSVTKTIRFKLNALTIIGATTEPALLPGPFRDRFPIKETLHHYGKVDLVRIIERAAARMKWAIDRDAACLLAKVSNGIPREALGHLLRCQDYAIVAGESRITKDTTERMLDARGIDEMGLTREHRKVLRVLLREGGGRPVSEERLAILTEIEPTTLRKNIEPTLIRLGLLRITMHGRVATDQAKAIVVLSEADPDGAFPVTPVDDRSDRRAAEA
jgi:Holliday junction DNA helicase RuvB